MIKLITDKNKRLQSFQITFENGYTIAVGIGSGHYCQNRINAMNNNPVNDYSIDCETSIIKPDGTLLSYITNANLKQFKAGRWEKDIVQRYIFPNELADIIAYVKSLEPNNYARVNKN